MLTICGVDTGYLNCVSVSWYLVSFTGWEVWVSEDELISIFKGGFRSRIVNRKWDGLQISQFTMFHITIKQLESNASIQDFLRIEYFYVQRHTSFFLLVFCANPLSRRYKGYSFHSWLVTFCFNQIR